PLPVVAMFARNCWGRHVSPSIRTAMFMFRTLEIMPSACSDPFGKRALIHHYFADVISGDNGVFWTISKTAIEVQMVRLLVNQPWFDSWIGDQPNDGDDGIAGASKPRLDERQRNRYSINSDRN